MTYSLRRMPPMRKRVTVRGRRRDRNVVMPPTLRYRSTSNSNSRSRKRASSRLRMRPWMEGLLDRNECSILRWEDRDRKTFSIAWRHASSHGFDQSQHGDLFSMWAQHTGKLKKNNQGDHSNNKSTFRCALHSLKDCIELTEKGDKRGEGAKRTYQFIDPGHQLYDRKRKRLCPKRNRVELTEEVNNCSFEFLENSDENLDYLVTEIDSSVMNMTSPSFAVSELSQQSPDIVSYPVNNDIKVDVTLDTSQVQSNSFITDDYLQEHKVPNFLTVTQPDGVIAVTLTQVNNCESIIHEYKVEPTTPNNHLPNFSALNLPDTYEPLNSICNPDLSCGGNVKVHKNKQETLSQPEFQIDYSLIQISLEQQQQQISLEQQQQISLEQEPVISLEQQQHNSIQQQDRDYGYTVEEVVSVDMVTDNVMEFAAVDEPNAEDNYFLQNQTQDQYQRVLTEMQPLIADPSLSAVEEESNYDDFSQFCQDIFSVGAC